MTMEGLETPQPHFIPGYGGYCPQFIYRVGDTYGSLTHKVLIDPCVHHAERLVLSNRLTDDYHVKRPTLREIDLVRNRELEGDPVYKHPIIPGYEGFIPRERGKFGQRFFVSATEALADFEKEMLLRRCNEKRLNMMSSLQEPLSLGHRSLKTSQYRYPLITVRPDCKGVRREIVSSLKPIAPKFPYSC